MGQDTNWIDSYREVSGAKNALKETTSVRKTRAGHILIELNNEAMAGEVTENLKKAMRQRTEIVPLTNRETLGIRNVDLIATKEELVEDISTKLNIKEERWIEVKSPRMTPWGTQQVMVVLPASTVPTDRSMIRIKTGLTIASAGILPNIVSCYRCHMLGHNAARCTVMSPGKELCRRRRDRDQTIN